jgi:ComF family protein
LAAFLVSLVEVPPSKMSYLGDFASLFFPVYCTACGQTLIIGEESLCLKCQVALPRTYMHDDRGNRLEKLFWGRVDIRAATAFLKMPRQGVVHHLIHELKYHDNKNIGIRLGKLFGLELKSSQTMNEFDAIIPVPLHQQKLYTRGYNQCDCIAEGLEQVLGIPTIRDNLVRIKYNDSQTRMGRYQRWENVETIFNVREPQSLKDLRILLVDDVITTGSTIESCANALNLIPGLKLSVASLALPVHG